MSFDHSTFDRDWLVIDDCGLILALVADRQIGEMLANDLGARLEQAARGLYGLGDTLPVFHPIAR